MDGHVELWGWDGAAPWVKVLVDAAGHLQVDVLTAGPTESRNYGYNGATWDRLRVESAAAFNLRVKVYDGANGIDSQLVDTNMTTERGLVTCSAVYGVLGADSSIAVFAKKMNADNQATGDWGLLSAAYLFGFDGTNWDRIRAYSGGILKVGRAEVGLLTARLVAIGQVGAAGARKLYWITMNPSAGASVFELADAAAPGGAVVYDHYHSNREAHHVVLDPPMEFSTGIYLETLANMTSIIFGYL